MWSSIKLQTKEMLNKKGFIITLTVMTFCAICSVALWVPYYTKSYEGPFPAWYVLSADFSFLLSSYAPLFGFFLTIFDFIIVLPFAASYIQDNVQGTKNTMILRTSRKYYFISKGIVCFLGTMLAILIPLLVNLLLCHIVFPDNLNAPFASFGRKGYTMELTGQNLLYNTKNVQLPFLSLFIRSHLFYNILYAFLFSLFAGLLGTFLLALSYFLKRRAFLLFLPVFVLLRISSVIGETALTAAMADESRTYINYSIIDYFTSFSYRGQSGVYISIVLGVIILFIIAAHIYAIKNEEV